MKYSYNWLKELFKDKLPEAKKLADLLCFHIAETTCIKNGSDFILDIETPANRIADLGSHIGIARDISAFLNLNLKPITKNKLKFGKSNSELTIEVKDKEACLQYCGLLIKNVKIKPSPKDIQEKLISCGLRPINNIVDITNLVMLEYGQPMHAFDYAKIKGHKILVRKAKATESIDTLDDKTRKLNENILVIADSEKPLAIAGIKGGEDAGIDKDTKDIVLESANFSSSTIYKTSKSLNLITDASIRFTHDLSPELTKDAIQRAAELIVKHASGKVSGSIIEAVQTKFKPTVILLNLEKIYRFLGFNASTKFIEQTFNKLGFTFTKRNPKLYVVTIPYQRQDLKSDDDLSGEIGRIFGFNNIPMLPPNISLSSPIENELYNFKQNIKNYSTGLGLSEIQEYNFVGTKEEKIFDKSAFLSMMALTNPQSSEYKYLRPFSLVSSLHAISSNVKYFPNARFFEVSKNFITIGKTVSETDTYSFALYDSKSKSQLQDLILEGKGIVESLFEKFGISQEDYYTSNILPDNLNPIYSPFVLDGRTIAFYANDKKFIGALFVPDNRILDTYDISIEHKQPVVVLGEINLNEFFKLVKREIEFKPLPKYPASIKDLSVLVPGNTLIQDVYLVIQKAGSKDLFDVDLFDVYEGVEKSGEKKSISFHLIFRSEDHTLTDQEINNNFENIVTKIKEQGWQVR